MQLESLILRRIGYGDNKGKYTGTVKFESEQGTIELVLPPELSDRFLRFASAELRKVSAEAADSLHSRIMQSTKSPIELPCATT